MQITEIDVKKGKRKRKMILISMSEADLEDTKESLLHGEFDRGLVLIVHENRKEEALEIVKGLA